MLLLWLKTGWHKFLVNTERNDIGKSVTNCDAQNWIAIYEGLWLILAACNAAPCHVARLFGVLINSLLLGNEWFICMPYQIHGLHWCICSMFSHAHAATHSINLYSCDNYRPAKSILVTFRDLTHFICLLNPIQPHGHTIVRYSIELYIK